MDTDRNTLQGSPRESVEEQVVNLIPALRAFARTFCKNTADTDDLVQETLTKALANVDKFERGTRLKSWLFTIMRNTFNTRYRVAAREAPGNEDCVADGVICAPTQEWSVRGRELESALGHLPDHYQEVLVLIASGESYLSAAERCDCAIGTVKSRLNRARHLLAQDLGVPLSQGSIEA